MTRKVGVAHCRDAHTRRLKSGGTPHCPPPPHKGELPRTLFKKLRTRNSKVAKWPTLGRQRVVSFQMGSLGGRAHNRSCFKRQINLQDSPPEVLGRARAAGEGAWPCHFHLTWQCWQGAAVNVFSVRTTRPSVCLSLQKFLRQQELCRHRKHPPGFLLKENICPQPWNSESLLPAGTKEIRKNKHVGPGAREEGTFGD